MADFRQIHTHIWKDPWFVELSARDKLLFIYLFSNELACLTGLYNMSPKVIAFETDIPPEEIQPILDAFEEAGKVYREGNLTWIPNLIWYNAKNITSPKIQAHLRSSLDMVPDCKLKNRWIENYNNRVSPQYRIQDTLYIPYSESESEHEHETEHDTELETEKKDPIASASANADNPANADKTPVTFAQWLEYLEPSKNRQALVRRMIEIFYPGHDPPDYGYIVKVAKKLGRGINGYRRLMELLWRQHTDPPKGDVLPYIMAIAKKDSATARHLHDHKGDPPPPLPPVEDDRTEEEKRLDAIWKQAEGVLGVALGVIAVNTYLHDSYLLEQTPERAVIVVHDELSSWLETDGWQRQIRHALEMNPDATIAFEVEMEAE